MPGGRNTGESSRATSSRTERPARPLPAASTAFCKQDDDELAFRLFSVMAGSAALVLFVERGFGNEVHGYGIPIPAALPVGLAFAMAWKPSSVWLSLAYWLANSCFLALGFPDDNTNQTLLFFVGLSVLAAAGTCMLEQRSVRVTGAALFRAMSPILRLCLVILYFWAIWDKLNTDFLDPSVSCAATLSNTLLHRLGIDAPIERIAGPAIVLTVLTEGSLAIGLFFRSTQRAAVVIGLGFHWLLGIAGFYGFSSTMIALLPLFLFPYAGRAFSGVGGRGLTVRVSPEWANRLLLLSFVVAALVVRLVFHQHTGAFGLRVWYGLPAIVALLWWNNRGRVGPLSLRRDSPPAIWSLLTRPEPIYLLALIHLLNGASPYLGLKTEYSYAMYSNLRTEGGKTNHLLWKRPWSLADYQTDLVYVLEGSDAKLLSTLGGRPVPRFVLGRTLSGMKGDGRTGVVLVLRDGERTRTIENAEGDATLTVKPSYLEGRFLRFRDIVQPRSGVCAH
jgi:hypothetical protein